MAKNDHASGTRHKKACCLVSEVLEELGLNSSKAREVKRQTLLGMLTFCQWQLARMDEETQRTTAAEPPKRRGRKVKVV